GSGPASRVSLRPRFPLSRDSWHSGTRVGIWNSAGRASTRRLQACVYRHVYVADALIPFHHLSTLRITHPPRLVAPRCSGAFRADRPGGDRHRPAPRRTAHRSTPHPVTDRSRRYPPASTVDVLAARRPFGLVRVGGSGQDRSHRRVSGHLSTGPHTTDH